MRLSRRWSRLGLLAMSLVAALALSACGAEAGSDEAASPEPAVAAGSAGADSNGDTGRMSEGEFSMASTLVEDLDGEISDYREKTSSRCAVLVSALEVAEALECVDDAYSGVEDSFGATAYGLGELEADVAKKCLKALRIAGNLADRPFYNAARTSKAALDSLDGTAIGGAVKTLDRQQRAWDSASSKMLILCRPA